jgi:hypothetical protein
MIPECYSQQKLPLGIKGKSRHSQMKENKKFGTRRPERMVK